MSAFLILYLGGLGLGSQRGRRLFVIFLNAPHRGGTAIGYGMDGRGIWVRFWAGTTFFFPPQRSDTQHPIQWVPGALSPGVSPPVFMAWGLIKKRDNLLLFHSTTLAGSYHYITLLSPRILYIHFGNSIIGKRQSEKY
jgi:hypothetical protein